MQLLCGFGTPGSRLVDVDREIALNDRIKQLPGLFDVVLAGEAALVAAHGVFEKFLVGQHVVGSGRRRGDELDRVADEALTKGFLQRTNGDLDLRGDLEADVVCGRRFAGEDRWRLAHAGNDLRAGHGEVFSGTDEEGNSLPAPGVNEEPEGDEGLDVGTGSDAGLV